MTRLFKGFYIFQCFFPPADICDWGLSRRRGPAPFADPQSGVLAHPLVGEPRTRCSYAHP